MQALKGRSAHKRESRSTWAAERLPEVSMLASATVTGDTTTDRVAQRWGEHLVGAVEQWRHREQRRNEGSYCAGVEHQARHIRDRYHVSIGRARLIASLLKGGVE